MNYVKPNYEELLITTKEENSTTLNDEVFERLERLFLNNSISCERVNVVDSSNFTVIDYEVFNYNITYDKIKRLEKSIQNLYLPNSNAVISPSKDKVGFSISIPKKEKDIITTGYCLSKTNLKSSLEIPIGVDEYNNPIVVDIAKMPHLLVSGTTGSGKSVCINSIISSILCNAEPYSVQFLMIDPKQVELSQYEGLKGFMACPPITNIYKASSVLYNVCRRMDQTYADIKRKGCKNIDEYNAISDVKLSKLIIVIDELADMMIQNKKEVEPLLIRIAQLGRACGIHLILGTQRPSREVVTGLLKVNIPARICFKVPQSVNSRVVLDQSGAEKLLGQGDGLFQDSNGNDLIRFQSAYISTEEVDNIINYINSQF